MVLSSRGLALVFLVAFAAADAVAQTPFLSGVPSLPRGTTSLGSDTDLALEGALDETDYVVGPGDVFVIAIGGSTPRQFTSVVSADGRLVIPEAGSFNVAGRTLAGVRQSVGAALSRQFRNVNTDVALSSPRKFSVHVSGAVPQPGRHAVRAAARVEDAIATARPAASGAPGGQRFAIDLGQYAEPPGTDRETRAAYRNVIVRHLDGTEDRVDLARYLVTGDVRYNPYLRDGDAIHLPTFDPARGGVFVGGAVAQRGVYDVRPDDSALALLVIASGGDPSASIRGVRITRAADGSTTEVSLAEAARVAVGPRDQLFALSAAPEAGTASAVGALRFPGTYPIREGQTTLANLVEMAGGLAPDALLRGAYLERRTRTEPLELREDVGGDPLDLASAPDVARFDSVALALGRLSDLDFVGRRLFQQETYRTPRLSLDLATALREGREVPLRDGDRLVVPADLGLVRVYGQVTRPGYLPYRSDLDASDYVEAAGGLAPAATEVYVVDAATGVFAAGGPVLPGDAIYASRMPTADTPQLESISLQNQQVRLQELQLQLQDRRDRQQSRFQLFQTLVSTAGAVATLIIAVDAIRN